MVKGKENRGTVWVGEGRGGVIIKASQNKTQETGSRRRGLREEPVTPCGYKKPARLYGGEFSSPLSFPGFLFPEQPFLRIPLLLGEDKRSVGKGGARKLTPHP